jgi:hypothetical protein
MKRDQVPAFTGLAEYNACKEQSGSHPQISQLLGCTRIFGSLPKSRCFKSGRRHQILASYNIVMRIPAQNHARYHSMAPFYSCSRNACP